MKLVKILNKSWIFRNLLLFQLLLLSIPLLLMGWFGRYLLVDIQGEYLEAKSKMIMHKTAFHFHERLMSSEDGNFTPYLNNLPEKLFYLKRQSESFFVLDQEGNYLLFYSKGEPVTINKSKSINDEYPSKLVKKMIAGEEGSYRINSKEILVFEPFYTNTMNKDHYFVIGLRFSYNSLIIKEFDDFFQFFIVMIFFGGFLSALTWIHYYYRIHRPIRLIISKNLESSQSSKFSYIDDSDIHNDELGLIMESRNAMMRNLSRVNEQTEDIINSLYDTLIVFTLDKKVSRVNPAGLKMLDADKTDLMGMKFDEFFKEKEQRYIDLCWDSASLKSQDKTFETIWLTKKGKQVPVLCSGNVLASELEGREGVVFLVKDLTQKKADAEVIATLSQVVDQSPVSVIITNTDAVIEYVNPYFCEETGYSAEEVIGGNPRIFSSGKMAKEVYEGLWQTLLRGQTWRGELYNKKKNGEYYWEVASISPLRNVDGEITNYLAIKEDISDRKKIEEELINTKNGLEQKVQERVRDLKNANDRLEKALGELKSLDRLKDDFLATVSHELRTPIASILGYADTIAECDLDDGQKKKFCYIIIEESERLNQLIENILDLSTMTSGPVEFDFRKTKLDDEIKRSIHSVGGLLTEDNNITINYNPVDIQFYGDGDRITQALVNLLGNAIKHSPDNGKIEIGVEQGADDFTVSIRDQGPGIPVEKLSDIFLKFQQIKRSGYNAKGTGLGLTISKKIIEGHMGTIWAENNSNGAVFKFRLPYKIGKRLETT
ncbi:MAG: PAS domain S-box protein [Deltaproteobacteria bacterium]|nr:PAS domain S-box protein [Deltaproteobacteria bacterium]